MLELTNMPEFKSFGKIYRMSGPVTITEKIDGTNGLIYINGEHQIYAGSRSRWLEPGSKVTDNFGFAQWVADNREDLLSLGSGYHYGEWYGEGINRGYGLKEKRFALFNYYKWVEKEPENKPKCCEVVPLIFSTKGDYNSEYLQDCLNELEVNGSIAVPGYMNPEGIIIRWDQGGQTFKIYCSTNKDK